ncbi:MAG: hypothetical protein WD022_02780 [Balneolaceae bacterium]
MPDKDYIHSKINKYYRRLADAYRSNAYQEKFPEAMNVGMKKCAIDYRKDVSRLASKIEKMLTPIVQATPLEKQNIHWTSVYREIEKIIQKDKGPKRIKGIINECSEKLVTRLKQNSNIKEPGYYLAREFLEKQYEADFKEPFRKEFSTERFVDRVEEDAAEKAKYDYSKYYANQMVNKESAKEIRKKPLKQKPKLDLDEEIG